MNLNLDNKISHIEKKDYPYNEIVNSLEFQEWFIGSTVVDDV